MLFPALTTERSTHDELSLSVDLINRAKQTLSLGLWSDCTIYNAVLPDGKSEPTEKPTFHL
jgi:hypothetical protein